MSAVTNGRQLRLPIAPESVEPAVHWLRRVAGALFFAILAPMAFGIFMVAGLLLALGLASIL